MPIRLEITCIIKYDRQNPHERIHTIGGSGFRYPLAEAIRRLDEGVNTFWTRGGGKIAEVVVATSAEGHKYLRTKSDGVLSDNLLYLPSCG